MVSPFYAHSGGMILDFLSLKCADLKTRPASRPPSSKANPLHNRKAVQGRIIFGKLSTEANAKLPGAFTMLCRRWPHRVRLTHESARDGRSLPSPTAHS